MAKFEKINFQMLLAAACLFSMAACYEQNNSATDEYSVNKVAAATSSVEVKMVPVPAGTFEMGTNDADFPDAHPVHQVTLKAFWMDDHEVTNAEFQKFVNATHYITVAEKAPDPKDFPGVPVADLVAGSSVFTPPSQTVSLANPLQWWTFIPGANWQHPRGPQTNIKGKENYPVVQVCYTDAAAYAKWAGKRLPTEAEWEYAAQGGHPGQTFYWGNELKPGGKWQANIFQGSFPDKNTGEDGFMGMAPIKSFPANGYGLHDMEGNVWEWCSDFYRADYYAKSPSYNPEGPPDSDDPDETNAVKRVQRGGSFLCSADYCIRYRPGSRSKGEINSASDNLGFRCVSDTSPTTHAQ